MRARLLVLPLAALLLACSPERAPDEGAGEAAAAAPSPPQPPGGVVAPATASATGESRSFRAWDASCDNVGRCTLFGFPDAEELGMAGTEGWAFLRIERGAEPDATPQVLLAAGEWTGEGGPAEIPLRVTVDGGPPLQLRARGGEHPYYTAELSGPAAAAFVGGLRNGRTVALEPTGAAPGRVSLDGAAAAFLWADERQGRAGGGRPGARPLPVVTAVQPLGGRIEGPPALDRWRAKSPCAIEEVGVGGNDDRIVGTRLTAELVLWEIPCGAGAYNFTTAFYFGDAAGGGLRPVPLNTDGGDDPAHHLVNAGLDGARLEAFGKARGIGDCGAARTWTWDGRSFVLTHHLRMSRCVGVTPDHWPVLHRAVVRGG
jgi:hypothetical protein